MTFNYQHKTDPSRELKFFYTNTSFDSLSYFAQIKALNNYGPGYDRVNARIGRVVSQHCLHLRGFIQLKKTQDILFPGPLGDFSPSQVTRLIIVEDLQPSSPTANPSFTMSDLLQEAPALNSVVSEYNFNNLQRFRIWFDKSYTFDAFGYTSGTINGFINRTCYWVDECIDLQGLETIYGPGDGSSLVPVSIHTSPLFLVCLSNTAPPPLGRDAERH